MNLLSRNESLSNVDTAWLRMEEPTNLMMVSGVMTFNQPIDFERLQEVIRVRLLRFNRFRQRVVEGRLPLSNPNWVDDEHFDLRTHVRRIALPAPGDRAALQDLMSDLASTPLDFARPLWQIHLVEGYGEGSALIVRLHHCIADGIALVFVLLSLTDMVADAPVGKPVDADDGRSSGLVGAVLRQATRAVKNTRTVINEGMTTLYHPTRLFDFARLTSSASTSAAKIVLRWPDPDTVFRGPLGVSKRTSWSRALSLADVKAIRKVLNGTVNDVLLTAMTGALRRYMIDHGDAVDGVNFRAAVPVNLRKPEEMGELGNKFGLVFLSLPIGVEDVVERLNELKRRMDAIKASPEAMVAFGMLGAIGSTPSEIQKQVVAILGKKVTAVMTNVPGPPIPLYLAGRELDEIMFWVPQSGKVGLGVSILSYAGKVLIGVMTDAGLVANPDEIVDHFYTEFEDMMALVAQAEAPPTAPAADTALCQGTTKAGRPCRRAPMADSAYCYAHQP